MLRPLEAIECLKRALLGADASEIQIKLKLARLYDDIEDHAAAALHHQRVIEICMAESKLGLMLCFRMSKMNFSSDRPIHTYARSCVYIARNEMESDAGNLLLARTYLERVAGSNAEEVNVATDLLRKLNTTVTGAVSNETQPSSAATASTVTTTAWGETSAPPTA